MGRTKEEAPGLLSPRGGMSRALAQADGVAAELAKEAALVRADQIRAAAVHLAAGMLASGGYTTARVELVAKAIDIATLIVDAEIKPL